MTMKHNFYIGRSALSVGSWAFASLFLWLSVVSRPASAALGVANVGVSNITATNATIWGNVTGTNGTNPVITIAWGQGNMGTNITYWQFTNNLGTLSTGQFSYAATNLFPATYYYWNFRATETTNTAWSGVSNWLTLARAPTSWPSATNDITFMGQTNGLFKTPSRASVISANALATGTPVYAESDPVWGGVSNQVQSDIDTLETATNALNIRADNLEAATNALNNRAGNLETATNALNTRAGNLETATNALNVRAGNLEGATNALNISTNALNTRAGNLEAATNALNISTNALNTRAGNLEASTNALNVRAGTLEAATNALNISTNALNTRASNLETATNALNLNKLSLSGGTMTGPLTNKVNIAIESNLAVGSVFMPTAVMGAVNMGYSSAGAAPQSYQMAALAYGSMNAGEVNSPGASNSNNVMEASGIGAMNRGQVRSAVPGDANKMYASGIGAMNLGLIYGTDYVVTNSGDGSIALSDNSGNITITNGASIVLGSGTSLENRSILADVVRARNNFIGNGAGLTNLPLSNLNNATNALNIRAGNLEGATNALNISKLNLSGGTMSGTLNMGGSSITNAGDLYVTNVIWLPSNGIVYFGSTNLWIQGQGATNFLFGGGTNRATFGAPW